MFHYTPKHASWMNQVEIRLSILVRKLLRRGTSARSSVCATRCWRLSATSIGREFVLNASDYASHSGVAVAFRRYLRRRNTDHHSSRIRLLESRSRVA